MAVLAGCEFGLKEPTQLARAIDQQDPARVERLLEQGADPNERSLGFPLSIAAAKEDVTILRLLLAHGADVDRAVSDDNWSPLFQAAQNGPPEAVRILFDAGANPCVRTSASWVKGLMPSEVARRRGNSRSAPLLEEVERLRCTRGRWSALTSGAAGSR